MRKYIASFLACTMLFLSVPMLSFADDAEITCPSDEVLLDLYKQVKDLEKVETTPPFVKIKNKPLLIVDSDGRVFSKDKLELNLTLPSDQYDNHNIYEMDMDIDLNVDVYRAPEQKSWWERNSFPVGIVVGGVTVSIGIFTILYLVENR